jgi:hypothetical protein
MLSTTIRSPLVVPFLNLDATWSWKSASFMRVLWQARIALRGMPAYDAVFINPHKGDDMLSI